MIDDTLLTYIKQQYQLPWEGIHGIDHWTRLWRIGMFMAPLTGANQKVVGMFAYIHDACRQNDKADRHHGMRAARLAARLNKEHLGLDGEELELLDRACRYHDRGMIIKEPTISTCWDADRLDRGYLSPPRRPWARRLLAGRRSCSGGNHEP